MNLPTLDFSRSDGKKLEFEFSEIKNTTIPKLQLHFHRHNFIEIVFVQKGTTNQIVDFNSFSVSENQVLIIPKNSVHQISENENYEGTWILFTDAFLNLEQSKYLNEFSIFNPILDNKLLSLDNEKEISQFLHLIKTEYNNLNTKNYELLLQNLFFSLLVKLENIAQEQYPISMINSEREMYNKFLNLLENSFQTEHSVSFYCDKLSLTSKKLNILLLKSTGKTTSDLIMDRIIIEAKRLLSYSEKSIKEIGFDLGFEDSHYFSRIFKKKTSTSPETFKKSIS
jgi:AraC family transcriptional regulator, transcriptional activator of pobA